MVDGTACASENDAAAGAVDDARPDRWGERVIRLLDRPPRLSTLDYLYFAGDERFGALGVSLDPDTYRPHARCALPMLGDLRAMHELLAQHIDRPFLREPRQSWAKRG